MTSTSDRSVYVVDDDEAVRDSLKALLESSGFAVTAFASAEAALDRCRDVGNGCLVVDVRMPGMTGIELQDKLRERGIDIPVIVVTGHGDIPLAVKAMKSGAVDFIEKPFANDRILQAVEHALASRRAAGTERGGESAAKSLVDKLTAREKEVLEFLASGYANKEIAAALNISPRTVEIHRSRVIEKLNAPSMSHLVRLALAAGIPLRDA